MPSAGEAVRGREPAFERKAGEHDHAVRLGHLSLTSRTSSKRRGFNIDRRKIELDQPIKSLGSFSAAIRLHRDVQVQIKVVVKKQDSEEEPG